MKKIIQSYVIAIITCLSFSCVSPEEDHSEEASAIHEADTADENLGDKIDMPSEASFKLNLIIANNIAAPVKLLSDMNNVGLDSYKDGITNPTDNLSKYVTANEKALSFGVYGADLSYIGLYNRNEEMADYLIAIRNLSEEIGLIALFNPESMEEFDRIKSNSDSVKFYIFDKYDQADDFLRSNERLLTATLIVTGGLIESLHLVSSQIESGDATKKAYIIFLEQKTTLKNLLDLYESLEADGQEVPVKEDIEMLYMKFEEVDSYEIFSKENIKPLHEAIDLVRNKMV